ncbi:MAG: hypothetical protein NWE94_04690 [Candidatus Bathyarchaeota archaeon]|nr:hypothetical protein [Candidatus Bathyarchaeota archaeon]
MSRSIALLLSLAFIVTQFMTAAKPVSPTSQDSWQQKTPIPKTEFGLRAASSNGKVYVIGDSINYEYDPATDKWTEKTPLPTPRTYFQIATYENKIYAIGGRSGWNQKEQRTILSGANEVYDPSTNTWKKLKPMLTNRSDISASVVNGKIHIIGTDIHEVYNIHDDSWTIGKPMSFPLLAYGYSSAVIDSKIYIVAWNQTHIYDPKSDSWSLGASTPIPVSNGGVCATTGVMALKRVHVIGGTTGEGGMFSEGTAFTQVYDPSTDTWILGEPMPTARLGLTVAVVHDQIYAIGGSTSTVFSPSLGANEQYTPLGYGTPDPTYDGAAPEVALLSPKNQSYYESSVPLEFSVNESAFWMHYKIDDETITEVSGNTTVRGLSPGSHHLTVYVFDEAGNSGMSETVFFTVEPFPLVPVAAALVLVAIVVVAAGLLVYLKKRKSKAG